MLSDSPALAPALLVFFAVYLISKWLSASTYQLKHIPTVGSPGIISSYLDVFRFFRHGHEMIQEGYDKAVQIDYTLGRQLRLDTYHVGILKARLTKNIAAWFSDIKDEIAASFGELVPVEGKEWTSIPARTTIMKIVCRTSNRVFVGLPLCREPEYIELNEQFAINVVMGAQLINTFPGILKPVVGRLLTKVPGSLKRAVYHLRPLIEAQLDQERKYGKDWPGKPNTFTSWLLDEAQGPQRAVTDLAIRLLAINFAAIHSTSNASIHILYDVATHPEYVGPMREEVEAIIQVEGWTKDSMTKMYKLDSFIKESQRLWTSALTVNRKIMKDFTFSNGVMLPAGTGLAVASQSTHMDERNYDKAHEFQGFRFAEMRGNDSEGTQHQIVSLTADSFTFGTGRHACPGRFLAANVLKTMLAYVLLNYDVKIPNNGPRPGSFWFQGSQSPNQTAEVMFRKRVVN